MHAMIIHIVTEDRTINDASRVISLEAPITSPDMPPKLLFAICWIKKPKAIDIPNDRKPT